MKRRWFKRDMTTFHGSYQKTIWELFVDNSPEIGQVVIAVVVLIYVVSIYAIAITNWY